MHLFFAGGDAIIIIIIIIIIKKKIIKKWMNARNAGLSYIHTTSTDHYYQPKQQQPQRRWITAEQQEHLNDNPVYRTHVYIFKALVKQNY